MNKILAKQRLSKEVFRMEIEAPEIAEARHPGQFIILQMGGDFGERIPLTIANADPVKGSITLIFQAVGETTHRLALLEPGDTIQNLLGPLGKPTDIKKYGKVVCVGGGIGVAPLFPIVEGMKKAGNEVTVIMGARTKELLIMEEDMRAIADEVIVVTDDGSYGRKALVTVPLKEICEEDKPDCVVIIGPPVMMKFAALTTKPYGIHTIVSLNTIMIDGTGMCGGCRVTIGGETKFVCVDGPEFDGHLVDWDNMLLRLGTYKSEEAEAHHRCHIGLKINEGEA
ncbi:sulfide/dihydroorotate dehydrogenase-like FAD/NAD-binding protein [Sphaerochaeta halotolerans]|jgi:ferredoxin--NADP+ reductase|uniref:Sulfide/dihydroorotate dehydrogenase-like FAD/NAD-binding protein n=1 Tax=Sphaerochaeta halotolerans TaxID=2293840 RepID=A0A372MJE8_9SPIR|nr:sulfide/dihydroorotate dehydrogenase-like FAD/NAD-binding protein [Sphaerochaeta halotolerans]MBG0767176.1 sulfide/dihydroorotate dehydrogenase-like FAD/NAD-binding protein [Spirochaetaceae bacterium]MDK2859295.1 ferredoxin/flavodoxin---NADP+ reductase [Sphaerochaeta sp.]MDN5334720.1 ferredoxin/flavodoxin---NADP+ reductase [Sphaerochaeta sp.]MXI85357.1 sulfide/dihydroorotate dehydrogenase-like FAD/NAD-binding protein [Sphaerochaeta halotolerans]RFU95901.1 sulfide/dihydroorotate dehydrogenas